MVNVLTVMLCSKNVKVVQCGLMKRILQDIKNGLSIMFSGNSVESSGSMEPTGIANIFKRSIT